MISPGSKAESSSEKLLSFLAASVCATVYVTHCFSSPDWLDSPELISASFRLGLYHPPGSPLAVMIGHAFCLLPFGQAGQIMLFFSAIWASLSVYVISRINQVMWRHLGSNSNRIGVMLVAPAMAMSAGLSPGMMSQAVRTEVYTLGLLLALLVVLQSARIFSMDESSQIKSPLDWASICTGLGLAVHPLVAVAPVPFIFLACLRAEVRRRVFNLRRIARSLFFLFIGAAPLALIGLMVHGWVDLRWGDPSSLAGWLNYITGATFSPTFSHGPTSMASNLYNALILLVVGTGWPLLILGLLGSYSLIRSKPFFALGLLSTILMACASLVLQRSFRLDNPDATGYALLAMVALGLVANIAMVLLAGLTHNLCKRCYLLPGAFTVLIGIYATFVDAPGHDRSGCKSSETIVASSLEALPQNSVVLAADFNLVFMMDYLTGVKGLRPDITILYLRDLENSALRSRLAKTRPGLAKHLPADSDLTVADILKLAKALPLSVDTGPHFPISNTLLPIRPAGLVWLIKARKDLIDQTMAKTQAKIFKNISLTCNACPDARTADVIAWHAYFQAIAAQGMNLPCLAQYMIGLAKRASPIDKDIAAVYERIKKEKSCVHKELAARKNQ